MEVLHRAGHLYAPQLPGLYQPSMPQLYAPSADIYTCYSLHITAPSRTPTPDHYADSYNNHYNNMYNQSGHTRTLQSVLRRDAARNRCHQAPPPLIMPHSLSSRQFYHSSPPPNIKKPDIDYMYSSTSPCSSSYSSSSHSPRPSSHESHSSQDSLPDLQTEPMDLSFKKTIRHRKSNSSYLDVSSTIKRTSNFLLSPPSKIKSLRRISFHNTTHSAALTSSSPSRSINNQQRHNSHVGDINEEFSLLRNLLSFGNQKTNSLTAAKSDSLKHNTNVHKCSDTSSFESFPRKHLTGSSHVQLAKKNLFPVSARVSDWLVKIVQFARSIPEFSALSHNDKITLILNSWTRIMLLYMAESNFQFAVTPVPTSETNTDGVSVPTQDEPSFKVVEGMQGFIKKCQQMSVDAKEYDFFRMLVLFNSGYPGLSCPATIDQLSSVVQQLLQQHVRVARPKDLMHYSRLLMCLPYLYSINGKMFENLFCTHITKTTDMEVLLKELIQTIP